MKTFLFTILAGIACLLSSCKEELPPETPVNPELNIEKYTFPKEGGTLEVYSTIGASIHAHYYGPPETQPEDILHGIDGGWYKVENAYENGRTNKTKICIEVQPNDTGNERILPIQIISYVYSCEVEYKQEK